MKKIIYTLSVMLFGMAACTGDFENMNRNPNQVTDEQMDAMNYKVGTKLISLEALVVPVQEHMYQFIESLSGGPFGGYIGATVDTWRTKFETFNPSSDWRRWPMGVVLTDSYTPYRGIVNSTTDEVAVSLAKLLRVAIMLRVTDSYGPIPYSDIENNESVFIAYDSQEQVFNKMFEELDAAISVFESNVVLPDDAFGRYDQVYYGRISQWLRYANSLKLRMAMRLSYVKPDLARTKAAEAIASGVIETNADNASMDASENRMTLIYNDWGDHRVSGDIISYMNGYEDPRREKMFLPNSQGVYAGIRVGIDVANKGQAVELCSNLIVASNTPYMWLNAAEATFLRAEYELRWGSADEAKSLYEDAIRLSFEEKGAVGAEEYILNADLTPEAYVDPMDQYSAAVPASTITIAWEAGTGQDIFERNLERIITQKWIAIFPLGVEAWSEYRRTGYPRLMPAVEDKSGGTVDVEHGARRMTYPVEEYQRNNDNLQKAIQMLDAETSGSRRGDIMGTRVWWDVKPYN